MSAYSQKRTFEHSRASIRAVPLNCQSFRIAARGTAPAHPRGRVRARAANCQLRDNVRHTVAAHRGEAGRLTKALVELHGGMLDLQRRAGVGTTVTIRFPAERIVQLLDDPQSPNEADRKAS